MLAYCPQCNFYFNTELIRFNKCHVDLDIQVRFGVDCEFFPHQATTFVGVYRVSPDGSAIMIHGPEEALFASNFYNTKKEIFDAAQHYLTKIDEIFGLYLDSDLGYQANYGSLVNDPDRNRNVIIGLGDLPSSEKFHKTKASEFVERNSPNGGNIVLLGNYVIVLLYEFWESEYRQLFAEALDIPLEDIKIPLLGELRLLRNAIIHHRAIFKKEIIVKLEIYKDFKIDDKVAFTREQIFELIKNLKTTIMNVVRERVGM